MKPDGLRTEVRAADGSVSVGLLQRAVSGDWQAADCDGLAAAAAKVVEIRVPLRCLAAAGAAVAFFVALNQAGAELEHQPRHGPIEMELPDTVL